MSKVFEKITNSSKRNKIIAVALAAVVCVTSVYHGFVKEPEEVKAATSLSDKAYIEYIMQSMADGYKDKFTIVEIVPHDAMGEFRYFANDQAVIDGLEARQDELKNYIQGDKHDTWESLDNYFKNLGYEIRHNTTVTPNKYEIRPNDGTNKFLTQVLAGYEDIFEDRLEVITIEANDLDTIDVDCADLLVIKTKVYNESPIKMYNAYTGKTADDFNAYKKNGNNYESIFGSVSYDSYEKIGDDYVSRDMTWDNTLELWDLVFNGKEIKMASGSVTTPIPVVIDDSDYKAGDKDGNMSKFLLLYRMLYKEQFAYIMDNGYISTTYVDGETTKSYINSNGLVTGCLSVNKAFASDSDLLFKKEYVYDILEKMYNVAEIKDTSYDVLKEPKHHSNFLSDYCWCSTGDNRLSPTFTLTEYSNQEAGTEFADRVGIPYTTTSVLRYLLGVKENILLTLNKKIKMLEIEPCASYYYDNETTLQELCEKMLLHKVEYDASGKRKNWTDGKTSANYITVDYMSSSAFNGINTDIVAEYDVVYIGMNSGILRKNCSCSGSEHIKTCTGKTIYNDSTLNGYVYLAFGDLIKAKTGISMYYPVDFVDASGFDPGDFDLMNTTASNTRDDSYTFTDKWYDRTIDDGNVVYIEKERENYTSKVIKYNNVYKMDTKLWNPLLYKNLSEGTRYVLENVDYLVSAAGNNTQLFENSQAGNLRLSGNDITQLKCDLLKEFADAGKLIVFADDLYNFTDESATVYPTSNVAEIAQYTIDNASNRTKESRIGSIITHINNGNPILTFSETPKQIAHDGGKILADSFSYTNTLKFKFDINGKADTKYRVTVYVDKNNDGVFDKDSAVYTDMNELFYNSKDEGDFTTDSTGLRKDAYIEIPLSDNYNGLISYKLEVIELGTDDLGNVVERPFRAGITGYTAIKGAEYKEVKVLQILPVPYDADHPVRLDLTYSKFGTLLDGVQDLINYNVSVTRMYTQEYEAWFVGEENKYNASDIDTNKLKDYDMVVLGFADLYLGDDISNDNGALDCLYDFVKSGKAVLFTHDTIGYSNAVNDMTYTKSGNRKTISKLPYTSATNGNPNVWGISLSRMFREMVGMDRYGISSATELKADAFKNVPYYKEKDASGNNKPVLYGLQGINNMLAFRHSNPGISFGTTASTNSLYKLYPYISGSAANYGKLMDTTKVTKLNDGQVTMYPYKIEESLDVATTHAQWYQLDMEDDEIVVWYTLAGDNNNSTNDQYYKDTDKDAGNNYYIYSKGNITYSGAGHRDMSSDAELKLFVNTVIKAITAGNNIPTVKVYNSSYVSTGMYKVHVPEYAEAYEFSFSADDLDLIDGTGLFKKATITWKNATGGEVAINLTHPTIEGYSNLTCNTKATVIIDDSAITVKVGDVVLGSTSITAAQKAEIDNLVSADGAGTGVQFEIIVDDMYDEDSDFGIANVVLVERRLYDLD